MATHKDKMTDSQMEENMAFWRYLQMKKKARTEGRLITEERQTIHAQQHMAHKPYGRM